MSLISSQRILMDLYSSATQTYTELFLGKVALGVKGAGGTK